MSGGLLQLAPAVLADGTPADQAINNTATATYEQAGSPTPINTTSNTVSVTVAEIAGVIVSGVGAPTGIGTGSSQIVAGNNLYYNFAITNVGNYASQFYIPGKVNITGPGTLVTTQLIPSGIEYSEDNGVTWLPVPLVGINTAKVGGTAVGDKVLVRVAINVNSNPGTTLDVRLGNGANNSTNENFVGSGFDDDVYTVPLAGRTPANIKRESSASVLGPIGSTANNVAFATVLETRTGATQNNTPAIRNDDVISYKLELKVANSAPVGTTPAPLAGTDVKVDGTTTTKRILVSNAVPAGTILVNPGASPVPSGWTRVYTSSLTSVNANDALWSTTFNAAATRIGFVSNTGATVLAGDSVDNLTFSVKVQGADLVANGSYNVDSIAQAFGSSLSGSTALIYDESGDQTSNNSSTNAAPTVTDGVALYTVGTADINNNNNLTGANAGNGPSATSGEVNRFTWTYTPVATNGLLNGPVGVPSAVGPGNSVETDFTNKSTSVGANLAPGATITPNLVGFDNTVQNTGSATANIKLLPTILATGSTLPTNTKVRIYDGATNQSATYQLNSSGVFVFVLNAALTGPSDVVNSGSNSGGAVSATNPVTLDGILSTGTKGYSVAVTLPANTPLSTDTLSGYPVVINAFTTANLVDATAANGTKNETIDRVYTGFLKLTKEARILQGTGPNVTSGGTFAAPNTEKKPAVGNYIEYRIIYKNISEPQVGTGNSILEANNLMIVEDGTGTNGSNSSWGKDVDGNGTVDTSHVLGSATDPGQAVPIQYFGGSAGATPASDVAGVEVTKYINRVLQVAPGNTGTFTFQRQVK